MKTLIQNGTIYDGSGAPAKTGDLLLEGDTILEVGAPGQFPPHSDWQVINAKGKAVTPGFIDPHRHCDLAVFRDADFGCLELAQGITTVLGGNCGLTPFPTTAQTRRQTCDFIEPCLGPAPASLRLNDYPDYQAQLEGVALRLNMGAMIGTGTVKTAAIGGFGKQPFTPEQMARAQGYLTQALENGAFGISCGVMYTPECYSSTEEFVRLLTPCAKYNRILTCHIRGEGDSLVSSVQEVIDIAQQAGLRVNISHFKAVGCRNWGRTIHQAIERIENARAHGQEVTVDFYPYTGGSTTLLTPIPPTFVETETAATLAKLATPAGVDTLRQELQKAHPGWDNMVRDIGWERIVISSVALPEHLPYQGKNIKEICEKEHYADETAFIADLLVKEKGKVGIIVMSMDPADVDTVARLPYSAIISDSLYGITSCPHPRLYGSFAKIIRDYVRERGLLSMEQAVHKMTGMTAQRFSIRNRGLLRPGYKADINIFDPLQLSDRATFSNPCQTAVGMDMVLVNGAAALQNGKPTNCRKGAALRGSLAEK